MLLILFGSRSVIAEVSLCQVLDRTEQLMRKGVVRYREDMDLENLIDFVQKKVNFQKRAGVKWSVYI